MPEFFTLSTAAARAVLPPRRSVRELVKKEIERGDPALPDDHEISAGIGWLFAGAA
jgi:hypothetical protein